MLRINNSLIERLIEIPLDDDFVGLDALRGEFADILRLRKEKYLNSAEFERIICWKLDTQAHRSKKLRMVNVDKLVVPITKAYFNLNLDNFDYETEVKIKILTSLKGVGTPLATAVMAITEPEKYCIIDSILWAFIFNQEKSTFSTNDYLKFHKFVVELSRKLDRDIQKTEFSLWKLSMNFK
jgi:hypothetical protein